MRTRSAALVLVAIMVAAGCTGGGDDDGGGGGETVMSGDVISVTTGGDQVLAGATVEAVGGPSTTSAADGSWTLLLASNAAATLRASAADHWGAEIALVVPPGGIQDLDMGLPQDSLVAAIGAVLGITPDTTKGLVAVNFATVSTAGGFAVTLSAANDGSFTFDSAGNPVISGSTLPNGDPTLIFVNVDAGTTTMTVTSAGGMTCANPFGVTSHPVDAKTVTEAPFFCQ